MRRDGPRVLGGEGAAPRRLRRGVLPRPASRASSTTTAGFGASDAAPGKPRQEIDPWEQIRDYQHAITYAQGRDDVDADRIGVWGSSYSGAHAYVVAAIDRRVKAVSGQVPLVSGRRAFESCVRIDHWEPTWEAFTADRLARARGRGAGDDAGGRPTTRPAPAALPTADSYEFFTRTQSDRAPAWGNEVTLRLDRAVPGLRAGSTTSR